MLKERRKAITGFGAVLLFVLGFVIFFRLNFTTVVVTGDSMLPTLQSGRKVLVSSAYWLVGQVKQDDVVVIRGDNNDYMIKRVFAVEGQTVDFMNVPSSWLLVDGRYVVPENSIYVMGDNRMISEDSRRFGAVELNRIIGKVVAY